MNRSKNHLLYQLYLEEEGYDSVFQKTSHISLGFIVDYFNYGDLPSSVDDYTERDFAKALAYKELEVLPAEELAAISHAIAKIDNYHENRNN